MKKAFLTFIAICLMIVLNTGYSIVKSSEDIVIDSEYSFEDIFIHKNIPEHVRKYLRLVSVEYFSFDNKLHRGQLVIHKDLVEDILEIFKLIKENKFSIKKVIPINKYNWSDDLSTSDNNTSAFNYRYVKGTNKLSAHSYGRAIDINPKQNPHLRIISSAVKNKSYDPKLLGTITSESFLVKEFIKRGWKWGGHWRSSKDYQHFEKLD